MSAHTDTSHLNADDATAERHRYDPRLQASSIPASVRLLLSPRPRAEALLGLSLADERALQKRPLKLSDPAAIKAASKLSEAAAIKSAEGTGEYLAPIGVPPARRHTLDLGGYFAAPTLRPPLTLFHELRGFFDQGYRLHCVRLALRRTMRARDWGCKQLFDAIDADGDGCVDAGELRGALEATGVRVRAMELDALMELLDADGSGTVEPDELFSWLFSGEDRWMEALPRRDADDPHADVPLLQRDAARFDPTVRAAALARSTRSRRRLLAAGDDPNHSFLTGARDASVVAVWAPLR